MNGRHREQPWHRRRGLRFVALAVALALALPGMFASSASSNSTGSWGSGTGVAAAAVPPGGLVRSAPLIGWTPGSFSVSPDGSALYDVPLWMPEGRGGLQPKLALRYDSKAGNGPVGVGWRLDGLAQIARCGRTPAQDGHAESVRYTTADAFCLDGNRLLPVGAQSGAEREYRTERETHSRIVAFGMQDGVPDHFKVWEKSGRILTLGQEDATNRARVAAFQLRGLGSTGLEPVSDQRVTAGWMLNRVEDRSGNAVTVQYARLENGEAARWPVEAGPSRIDYGPNRSVRFGYESRPDRAETYESGVHTWFQRRLSSIQMWAGPEGGQQEMLRTYNLGYEPTTSDSVTGRSLLSEVEECDRENVCKLPQTFEWSLGSFDFDVRSTSITDVRGRVIPGDVNGDGRDDLLYVDSGLNWKIRYSTGTGFGAPVPAGLPRKLPDDPEGIQTTDVNRDGMLDVLLEVETAAPGEPSRRELRLYASDGLKLVESVDVDQGRADDKPDEAYFADLDGNGMPDYISATFFNPPADGGRGGWYYRLNTGQSGVSRWRPAVRTDRLRFSNLGTNAVDIDGDGRVELFGYNPDLERTETLGLDADGQLEQLRPNAGVAGHVGDLNGDGVDDVIYPYDGLAAQLNSGNGFDSRTERAANYRDPDPDVENSVRVVDVTGDGALDVLVLHSAGPGDPDDGSVGAHLWTWNGTTFVREPLRHNVGRPTGNGTGTDFFNVQPLDIDGDDVLDLVANDNNRIVVHRRTGDRPDLMVSAGVSAGKRVEVDYATLADRSTHVPGTCTYPLICVTRGGAIVKQHRETNPEATERWSVFDHTYTAARNDVRGGGWLGFATHTVTDRVTGGVTVTEYDNVSRIGGLRPEVYPFARLAKLVTTTVPTPGASTYRKVVTNTYAARRVTGGSYTVELTKTGEAEAERPVGGPSFEPYAIRTTTNAYDDFGNLTSTTNEANGGRRTSATTIYQNDTASWLLGLPKNVVTRGCLSGGGACVNRTETHDYDAAGRRTETVAEPDDNELLLRSTTAYGDRGQVVSVSVRGAAGAARTTRFGYDADKLLATSTTNAVGHVTRTTYHSGLGVPLSTTDPNGVQATMRYDGFGREREVNRADGSFERTTHVFDRGLFITTVAASGGGKTTTETDRFGRLDTQLTSAFDGALSRVKYTYNALGEVAARTRPSTSGVSTLKTTYTYDNRGRLLSRVEPDGATVRHGYDKLTTTTTDARGIKSQTKVTVDDDIANRLEDDPASTGWLTTSFAYGPFGEIIRAAAPDGTAQTMTYDRLGRKIRHVDPASGTTTATYDPFGEIASETTAVGETTRLTRDLLGRPTTVTSPDGTETRTYDTAANGLGQPAQARSADGVLTRYGYDSLGRPATSTWTVDGVAYELGYGYDNLGRQSSTTYPRIPGVADRFRVENTYNAAGYLHTVRNPADGTVYWQGVSRTADGALGVSTFNNGRGTETRTYSDSTGLLTSSIVDAETRLQHTTYQHDANRNLTKRDDRLSRNETFGYDSLNRLVTWEAFGAVPATTYTYDKSGNLTREATAGRPNSTVTYKYGENGEPKHALTTRNSDRYTYDAAGRQITGPRRTMTYNQAGLPKSIVWGDPQLTTTYTYDADGVRVRKHDPGQTVVSIGGIFQTRKPAGTGNSEIHNLHTVVANGRAVAQVNLVQAAAGGPLIATKPWYIHTDNQGTTTVVTNAAGRRVGTGEDFLAELFYDPFGRRTDRVGIPLGRQRHGAVRLGFAGLEHEDENAFIDMNGRIYDAEGRRFLTPDPYVTDPMAGQNHNRYAYVLNNPATNTDPTGYQNNNGSGSDRAVYTQRGEVVEVKCKPQFCALPPSPEPSINTGEVLRGWGGRAGSGEISVADFERFARNYDSLLREQKERSFQVRHGLVSQFYFALVRQNLTKLLPGQLKDLITQLEGQGDWAPDSQGALLLNEAKKLSGAWNSLLQGGVVKGFEGPILEPQPSVVPAPPPGTPLQTKSPQEVYKEQAAVMIGSEGGNILGAGIFWGSGNLPAAQMANTAFGLLSEQVQAQNKAHPSPDGTRDSGRAGSYVERP